MGGKRVTAMDAAVGKHIRAFRNAAGLTQTEVADQIGVTFQQLQKYENGTNRVSAGRLTQIANVLNIPLTAFFEDVIGKRTKEPPADSSLHELMAEPRAHKLLEAFCRMPDPLQIAILQFVRAVGRGAT
jgi:transcriptional regulator with XRE-family HTH domain